MEMILVGDIGGTKTRLHLFDRDHGPDAPIVSQTYASRDFDSLEAILQSFLEASHVSGGALHRAVFGIAGPVVGGRVEVTNLPWVIEKSNLTRRLNMDRVALLNDLQTVAYALPHLEPDDRIVLNAGRPASDGTRAVIAPGTGLGEAFLVNGPQGPMAHPTEGGHVSFAPRGEIQIRLLRHLSRQFEHVSFERVCSGIGIPHLYDFFHSLNQYTVSPAIHDRVTVADDPTPIIIDAALAQANACPLCVQVLHTFVEILGAAAGNLALKVAAMGGVYVAGGIPPRIPEQMRDPRFMAAFTAKGRMTDLLRNIPVYLVTRPDVGVFGAACYGFSNP